MKKFIIFLGLLTVSLSASGQRIAIKNNLLADATLSANLGVEFSLGRKTTLDIYGSVNMWDVYGGKKMKHWLAQPEFRYWTCESFNGFFMGVHGMAGDYNVGFWELPFEYWPELKDHRYEGSLYGGGITVGYQWILGRRWNLEAAVGGGYCYIEYDKFAKDNNTAISPSSAIDYIGLTKLSLSLVFFFN